MSAYILVKRYTRSLETVARSAAIIAELAGIALPSGKSFMIVPEYQIGKEHAFSGEKFPPVLAIFRYRGFDTALNMMEQIF
jgi:sulfoacetaldehyde dehydrogenase